MCFFILMGFFVLRCEEAKTPPGGPEHTDTEEDNQKEKDETDEEDGEEEEDSLYILDYEDLPQGSEGEQCQDDKDCEDDLCDDFLNNATACEKLPLKTGNRVLDSLKDLQRAEFKKVDLKSLGLAFSIEEDFWLDIIKKDYDRRDSREALEWIAETEELLKLLLQLDEDALQDIIHYLVIKLYPYSNKSFNINYRTLYVSLATNSSNNFFKMVLKEDFDATEELIEFLHEHIVKDSLCGNSNAWPAPSSLSWRGTTLYYTQAEMELAEKYAKEACSLAVWFNLITRDKDRARVAGLAGDEENDFITRLKTEGGLSYTEGEFEDADEWPDEVFERLKRLWTSTLDSLPFRI